MEQRDYVPPQVPTFAGRIQSRFEDSLQTLLQFGQGLTIFAVAVFPWLVELGTVLFAAWGIVRLLLRLRS